MLAPTFRAMVHRPNEANPFEFVIVASLRAAQLMRGCVPRVDAHAKAVVTAQREVAAGRITRTDPAQANDDAA